MSDTTNGESSDTINYEYEESPRSMRGRHTRGQRGERGRRDRGRGDAVSDGGSGELVRGRRAGRARAQGRPRGAARARGEGRARAQGRPRGAGRPRRAGRVAGGLQRDDRERVQARRQERRRQTQELIRNLDEEILRELVLQLVDRQPGLVFDLCEAVVAREGPAQDEPMEGPPEQPRPLGDGEPDQPGPDERGPSTQQPTWCRCGNCRPMPTDVERKCRDCLPQNCISQRLEMDTLVLDPQVLALGNQYHRDMLGRYGERIEDHNKSMRHAAYRNFTLWRHGRLGQGVRRVIPSCCVWRTRRTYPSTTNTYTGYLPHRLA